MSRRHVDTEVRYPLWSGIPDAYAGFSSNLGATHLHAEETFFQRLVSAFDAVLAPAHSSIEDIDLYLDASTCPADFLPWLAGWLGVTLNDRWPLARRRHFVTQSAEVFRLRGTLEGVRQALALSVGESCHIEDSGDVSWNINPQAPIAEVGYPSITVRLPDLTESGEEVDSDLVRQLCVFLVPAHVTVDVR